MKRETILEQLSLKTDSKIILFVMDGLGDLPVEGKTALEAARTPNLDRIAAAGVCGLTDPVFMGITPGSGPAHLALFGYDPTEYILGRGILEALGVGVAVGRNDLVARGNFATLRDGLVIDRRAGRIPTEENAVLCQKLNASLQPIENTEIRLFPGKEHRFVIKLHGEGLSDRLSDADPQKDNQPLSYTQALSDEAQYAARVANAFIDQATEILSSSPHANTVLLRGFATYPSIPTLDSMYKLHPAAIAQYPMYKGLAQLVGMDVLPVEPEYEDLFHTVEKNFNLYDFFYMHFKKTDSYGEDGNFKAKTAAIEEADRLLPRLLDLHPDVLVITSDHSTPSLLKGHSWHPNPFVLFSRTAQPDAVQVFTETACAQGYLGRFPATHALALMLAHAMKLSKFGA